MTRILFTLILTALATFSVQAQNLATPKSELKHCGVTERGAWIDAYQRGEIAAVLSENTILLPLRIHIVGTTSGDGYTDWEQLFDALTLMNEDFATANVTFYIDGEIDFINNSNYYDHSFSQGASMMAFNNDNGVINCYFVGNPAGACGYYSPSRDAVAIGNNCLGADDHTWGHELGHFFQLPHTFSGWEGYYDGDFSFADAPRDTPAPNFVGGRAVEKADSSNCANAGDGFCDTPADYLSERWPCAFNGVYADSLMDQDGQKFVNYAYPIMGYANDNCVESFTDEQRTAMVTNINNRGNLASNLPIETEPADPTSMNLLLPEDGEQISPVDVITVDLSWSPADNADFYIVHLATNQFYTGREEFISYDTTFTLTADDHGIQENRRYWWRIRPVNRFVVENDPSDDEWDFRINDLLSSTTSPELDAAISIYPNPVSKGNNSLLFSATGLKSSNSLEVSLVNTNGQIIRSLDNLTPVSGALQTSIDLQEVPNGVYFLRIRQQDRLLTRRVVVAK